MIKLMPWLQPMPWLEILSWLQTHAMIDFSKWLVCVVQVIHYNGCGPYPANCGNNNNQTSQVSVSVILFSSFIQVKFNIFIIFKNLILMSCD